MNPLWDKITLYSQSKTEYQAVEFSFNQQLASIKLYLLTFLLLNIDIRLNINNFIPLKIRVNIAAANFQYLKVIFFYIFHFCRTNNSIDINSSMPKTLHIFSIGVKIKIIGAESMLYQSIEWRNNKTIFKLRDGRMLTCEIVISIFNLI